MLIFLPAIYRVSRVEGQERLAVVVGDALPEAAHLVGEVAQTERQRSLAPVHLNSGYRLFNGYSNPTERLFLDCYNFS